MNNQIVLSDEARSETQAPTYEQMIDAICALNWTGLTQDDVVSVAWAYYFFSIQFRECLEIARRLLPEDARLIELDRGERDTDNLSPWPGVAAAGEKMNHDEFMRRTLGLADTPESRRQALTAIGENYLATTRAIDGGIRSLALASYEDGGLERVFGAMLTAPHWDGALQKAFQHFLVKHIQFDSDPNAGHGALCRHLTPDDRIVPLWSAFKKALVDSVPRLAS